MAIIQWLEAKDNLSDLYVKRYVLQSSFMTNGDSTVWLPIPPSSTVRWSLTTNNDWGSTAWPAETVPAPDSTQENMLVVGANADVLTPEVSGVVMAQPTWSQRKILPQGLPILAPDALIYTFTGEISTPHSYLALILYGTPGTAVVVPAITIHQRVSG